jgi:hypothetical protein
MFPRNILTILKDSSFLCVLATKMVYATDGTHLRHVHTEKSVILTLTLTHNPNLNPNLNPNTYPNPNPNP